MKCILLYNFSYEVLLRPSPSPEQRLYLRIQSPTLENDGHHSYMEVIDGHIRSLNVSSLNDKLENDGHHIYMEVIDGHIWSLNVSSLNDKQLDVKCGEGDTTLKLCVSIWVDGRWLYIEVNNTKRVIIVLHTANIVYLYNPERFFFHLMQIRICLEDILI